MGLTRYQREKKAQDERQRAAGDRELMPFPLISIRPRCCRSVWCPDCRGKSRTNAKIQSIMRSMCWRKVRHVVLTVSRDIPPKEKYRKIREGSKISRTMKHLGTSKWIWILEFHKGGWPHWHVVADTGGKMLGHARIGAAWGEGIVWESRVASEDHWFRLIGYHNNKGYIGGDDKGHQVSLPEYLKGESRVRKYGVGAGLREDNPKQEPCQAQGGKRRAAAPYGKRFDYCDTETEIHVGDRVYIVHAKASAVFDRVREVTVQRPGKNLFLVPPGGLTRLLGIYDESSPTSPI